MSKSKPIEITEFYEPEDVAPFKKSEFIHIDDFLETGKSNHLYKGNPIFRDDEHGLYMLKDGFVYFLGVWQSKSYSAYSPPSPSGWEIDRHDDDEVVGVMIPGLYQGDAYFLLSNADNEEGEIDSKTEAMCSVSFQCLKRLIFPNRKVDPDAPAKDAMKIAISGELEILDFVPDTSIKSTASVRAMWRDKGTQYIRANTESPAVGFTFLGGEWHRSATLVVRHNEKTYLLGQDEDTYFGCELQGSPETVQDAFTDLMPKSARNAKGVLRQGEWFAIPANKVPALETCIAEFRTLDLPRPDGPESAVHRFTGCDAGRIGRDGSIYVSGGTLCHMNDDHEDLFIPKGEWRQIARNTAVRSVSVDGVD
jgi:hypothetical protein